jgi:hypothetical protein
MRNAAKQRLCSVATRRVAASLILRVQKLPQSQQALDRDVFVKRFPVDTEAAAEKLPIVPFFWRRVQETRVPFEWDRDLTAIGEYDLQHIAVTRHINGKGLNIDR